VAIGDVDGCLDELQADMYASSDEGTIKHRPDRTARFLPEQPAS
jgi:hypothetical protein